MAEHAQLVDEAELDRCRGEAGAADLDVLVGRVECRGDLFGERRLGEPGVALDTVERAAEDDLRERAPDVGEGVRVLVVAPRWIGLPHEHRLVEPAAEQIPAELAYSREVKAKQLVARDRPPERALAVGDKAVHRDAHRVDQHGLHGNGTARGHMVGDLFHAGHVALLREARRHGDWLIVGVLSDETAASPTLSMGIASSCMTAPPCSGCPPRGLYGRRTPLPPSIRLSPWDVRIAGRFLASAVLRSGRTLRGYWRGLVAGPLHRQQHQGSSYCALAAIGHKVGMNKQDRTYWYRICEAIPFSQRHAGHILSKL